MFETIDPFTATPAELLAEISDMEPCSLGMSVLLMIDRSKLTAEDAITFLQVHERVAAWWASFQTDALVAAASPERMVEEFTLLDPRPDHDEERTIRIEDAVREEVAAALHWSPATTQSRIDTARLLAGPLRETNEALALGDITTGHVAAIVEEVRRLPGFWRRTEDERTEFASACASLESAVLPVARRGTLARTRAAARRAVLRIDAEGQRRRRLAARCTRSVYVVDELDGLSTLMARMSTETAHALLAAIDARAQESQAEAGVLIGERRADALAHLVLDGAGSGRQSGSATSTAHVDVVIGLETLLGLDDEPGQLRGSGPVTADVVRDLMADPEIGATMRRLVTHPLTGHLIDVGRSSYEVPTRLRAFIAARDQVCRFPGCRRSASRCQIDHAIAWEDGGRTDAENLGALCVRHHQLKTHAGWRIIDSRPDGSCTWISPQGRRYLHEPERVVA